MKDRREGAKAQASCVTLNKSLNLSGPLSLYLAMLAAPSPADLGLYGTSSERLSLTLNYQFGLGDISALSVIKISLVYLRLGPLEAGVLPLLFTSVFPCLLCHHPGGMSGKSFDLELWRPAFITPASPHRSSETLRKQIQLFSGSQFLYLKNRPVNCQAGLLERQLHSPVL